MAYLNGEGVPKDLRLGRRYIEMAASMNQPDALVMLGYMFEKGLAVPRDLDQARLWYERAVKAGNRDAERIAGAALRRMSDTHPPKKGGSVAGGLEVSRQSSVGLEESAR